MRDGDKLTARLREAADELDKSHRLLDRDGVEYTLDACMYVFAEQQGLVPIELA